MLNEFDDIEQLFNERFKNAQAKPDADIWAKLESNLEKQNVEGIYQSAFQNAAVHPSASLWKKISTMLALKSFLSFKFTSFNIYYASIITAFLGVSTYTVLQNNTIEKTKDSTSSTLIAENTSRESSKQSIQEATSADTQNDRSNVDSKTHSSSYATGNNSKATNTPQTNQVELVQNQEGDNSVGQKRKGPAHEERIVDWSLVQLTGSQSVCENVPTIYAINGLTVHADVQWVLPKGAQKNNSIGHQVSLIWKESGNQKVTAIVKVGKEKQSFELPVAVEAVAVPSIKGRNRVCQGMEKQLYYVDEEMNKEISYLWEAQCNPIDQIGNKYINIDWTKSGKDTISVTKVNTTTGCKSFASMAIFVNPKPEVDFIVHPLGHEEYEFSFEGKQSKGCSFVWNIEGYEYTGETVTHTCTGTGSSFVTLTVTDKNRCINTIQKEVDFNKNFIAVPTKFMAGNGRYFLPMSNADLQKYRLEIYNAHNEKIWESSELDNGRPSIGWDGKVRGSDLPAGKYLWKITATFEDGTQWKGVTQPNGTCKPSGIFILE